MLTSIDILKSEELFEALSRLWRQIKPYDLTVFFNCSDLEAISESCILGIPPLSFFNVELCQEMPAFRC
jgi:hypothetical protein